MNCPHLSGGVCGIATAILGRPCAAHAINCERCQGVATLERPTPEVLGLVTAQARRDGLPSPLKPPEASSLELRGYEGFFPCVHRGDETRVEPCQSCSMRGKMAAVYPCGHFKRDCTTQAAALKDEAGEFLPTCMGCKAREAPAFNAADWRKARCSYLSDPGWAGRFEGGHLILVCGGPSLASVDWSRLPKRGPVVMAINNGGADQAIPIRPDLWIGCDDAGRFAPEIWNDPGVAKFYPQRSAEQFNPVQEWSDGWRLTKKQPKDFPNVHWIARGGGVFNASTFFTSKQLQFCRTVLTAKGNRGTCDRSTMLYALRLAVDLGFRSINIVGADFTMPADGQQYGWKENAKAGRASTNGSTFRFVNLAFRSLSPYLSEIGCKVWNCTPGGRLEAFPRRPFEAACREAGVSVAPTLQGLYNFTRPASK